jgi:hypothetical protein
VSTDINMHEAAVEADIIGEIAFDAELTDGFSSGVDAIDPEDAIGSHELAVLTGRKEGNNNIAAQFAGSYSLANVSAVIA